MNMDDIIDNANLKQKGCIVMRLATEINHNIIESMVDGENYRLVLFTQGCKHCCKGCHNKETWDMNGGIEYTVEEISNHLLNLYRKYKKFYGGITLSGGDPLMQRDETKKLLEILKKEEPEINIWLYTGYDTNEVIEQFNDFLDYVDVFVTGRFVEELKSYECKFRGSTNQELFRVNEYLSHNLPMTGTN